MLNVAKKIFLCCFKLLYRNDLLEKMLEFLKISNFSALLNDILSEYDLDNVVSDDEL
jgi:hypothetical protein